MIYCARDTFISNKKKRQSQYQEASKVEQMLFAYAMMAVFGIFITSRNKYVICVGNGLLKVFAVSAVCLLVHRFLAQAYYLYDRQQNDVKRRKKASPTPVQ